MTYRLKNPWRNGTTHVVFEPIELIAKLAALVPTPKAHLVRYSGILAPAAKWRALIVPAVPDAESGLVPHPRCAMASSFNPGGELPLADQSSPPAPAAPRPRNYTWAELMRRVFAIDVLKCARCGGRMRILAAIHPPDSTRKILDCLGLPSRAPPLSPAVLEYATSPEWS